MLIKKITLEQFEKMKHEALRRPMSIIRDFRVIAEGEEYIVSAILQKKKITVLQALHYYEDGSSDKCEVITDQAILTALLEFMLRTKTGEAVSAPVGSALSEA